MAKSQKSVLINGCSSGVGNALAREFHEGGLQVFATARSAKTIQDLADLGMMTFELDVTSENAVLQVRDQVAEITGGKLDILVNNAGQYFLSAASDCDIDRVEALYRTNLFGAMRMVKAYVPLLIASGDARILQIGSLAGIITLPFTSAYNSTKAALHAYGDTLRVELAPFNIKVINACTGGVKSKILRARVTGFPDGSIYKPIEDIFVAKRVNASLNGAMTSEDYAKHVVPLTLKKSPPPWIWSGSKIWRYWFLNTFTWRTASDWILSKMFGLSKLKWLEKAGKSR